MRFRIGDRELELDLLTIRLKRKPQNQQQFLQHQPEKQEEHEDSEEFLEVTF